MNDRLGDLPDWALDPSENDEEEGEEEGKKDGVDESKDLEMNEPKKPSLMDHFFKEIDGIKADIDFIGAAARKVGEITDGALAATTTEEENELSGQLRPLVDATNKKAKQTKTMLGLLTEESEKLKTEGKIKASDLRIRDNLINTLTRKFIDEMKLYQAAQQKYKSELKKKVARQVQIVKPDATDEEIDAVMRSDGGRDELYKQQILSNTINDEIKTTYNKVANKYQDVLAIEQSVAELHQMFLDMALITEQQGELLDRIEYQVTQAADYVEDANEDLYESVEYQNKIRKKQCLIMVIVAGAIGVLALVIL